MNFEIELPLSNRTLSANVPTLWNDMTPAQVAHLLKVFGLPFAWANSIDESFRWKQIQILKALTKWTDDDLNKWQAEHIVDDNINGEAIFYQDIENVCDQITEKLAKRIDENNSRYELIASLTKNPYPKIEIVVEKGKTRTFYAAKSSEESPLDAVSLDELSRIFTLWEAFRDSKEEHHFNEMLAILYRPKKSLDDRLKKNYDGDIRQRLENDEAKITARAKIFEQHVTENFRITVDFHIASCREAIAAMYPSVFGRKQGSSSTDESGDWLDLIIALADDDFGKKDLVMSANAHDSLAWADRIREKTKKELKKTKS